MTTREEAENIMKSPFTGGKIQLVRETREMTFRKEKFSYVAHFYICVDTSEQFTTTELDTLNINQIHNQYRVKYEIPFPDEISNIRQNIKQRKIKHKIARN